MAAQCVRGLASDASGCTQYKGCPNSVGHFLVSFSINLSMIDIEMREKIQKYSGRRKEKKSILENGLLIANY
jgi:hypothetical protein